jgi:MarR family transcriptional regulator, 2-MHQ and catechol-resistance regulon repressor
MKRDELERMADGIVRLRAEILRRRGQESGIPAGSDLTTPQALALRAIVLEGPLRMGALAEELGVSVATASRTVDALVARQFVRREPDPDDARAVRVAASARGRAEHALRRERFMEELPSDEREELTAALETVNRLLVVDRRLVSASGTSRRTG